MNFIKKILRFINFALLTIAGILYSAFRILFNYFALTSLIVGIFSFCAWDISFLIDAYKFWTPTTNISLIVFRMLCWITSVAWLYALSNMRIVIGVLENESINTKPHSKH